MEDLILRDRRGHHIFLDNLTKRSQKKIEKMIYGKISGRIVGGFILGFFTGLIFLTIK